jgi:hypothetical protein
MLPAAHDRVSLAIAHLPLPSGPAALENHHLKHDADISPAGIVALRSIEAARSFRATNQMFSDCAIRSGQSASKAHQM